MYSLKDSKAYFIVFNVYNNYYLYCLAHINYILNVSKEPSHLVLNNMKLVLNGS